MCVCVLIFPCTTLFWVIGPIDHNPPVPTDCPLKRHCSQFTSTLLKSTQAHKHTSTSTPLKRHCSQAHCWCDLRRSNWFPNRNRLSVSQSDKDCLQKWILARQVEGPLSLHYIRPEDLQVDAPYGLKQIRLESSNWFVNSCKTSLKVLCPYIMSEHKILKWMFHHCSIWTETDTTGKLPWRDKITAIRAAIPQVDDSHILSVKNYPLLTWQL